ncbi:MAG: HD-GYP domain-containing protein, partial [Heliobacteriaceae bacterium]|nr:HD-GYP domain-containing protein [Heliobacteriaceae bacterium]
KCNGTGYPVGLKYADIHLFARIVAVADISSALTTRRAYRERLNLYRATDILRNEFKGFLDKHIVFVLMDRLHDLLLNNRVCLSSGEVGCVIQFFEDAPLHPLVLVTNDKEGRMLVSPYLLNLRETTEVFVERVVATSG